ncbi:DUF4386 domain-containing protein [Rhodococcus phenolicus]|uniref:DUF4386 domain-containing protein n=1 Tax=Rhodococcus phenolicus TaxID=263849 RepID=UPI00083401C8|nr:DUF4386 domain-containing protein [Rhodococcus phenolicus]
MSAVTTAAPGIRARHDHALRITAFVAGTLYLLTFATSIPTLGLYEPVLDHPDFVLGAGSADSVLWGAFSEVVLAFACVGTAVVLFPVARRQSETAAVGFVVARVLEAGLILIGVAALLSVVSLRQEAAGIDGADATSLVTAGRALVAVHDWTFLLGQSLMPVVNALCLGYVLYRSGLVPRIIPVVGLAGAPLLLASDIALLFGAYAQRTPAAGLAALPVAAWEFALGAWLVVRGFRPARPA